MIQLDFVLLISCFTFHVKAQNDTDSEAGILKHLHPSLAVVVGIISVVLFLTFLILAYAKFCQRYPLDIIDLQDNFQARHARPRLGFSGIDQAVINKLPFFTFSSLKGSKEGLECAVCLSKFDETEVLRLLPKCKHAFHKTCIDQWLQVHSICPLCRHKLEPNDIENFNCSTSLRYSRDPSNLANEPNLEIFIEREQNRRGSSRFNFNIGNSFRDKGKNPQGTSDNKKILHKSKHKIIIVSDVVINNRWSDVNSSDLLFLSSEMLGDTWSRRFSPSPSESTSKRFREINLPTEEIDTGKIKEVFESKRVLEIKNIGRIQRSNSFSSSTGFPAFSISTTSYNEDSKEKMINNPVQKRSMSEITGVSRFGELNMKCTNPRNCGREEKIRRLWLPIARRTVQWLAGRESMTQEEANV